MPRRSPARWGPSIGGVLTGGFSWRAVLLVNVPLAVFAVLAALRSVPPDPASHEPRHVDLAGTVLLSIAIIGLVFGLTQSQPWGWTPVVIISLAASVAAAIAFAAIPSASTWCPPQSRARPQAYRRPQSSSAARSGSRTLPRVSHQLYPSPHGIANSPLPDLTAHQALRFKAELLAAEQTGLPPKHFAAQFTNYLPLPRSASDHGYIVAVLTVSVLALTGLALVTRLVRRPPQPSEPLAAGT